MAKRSRPAYTELNDPVVQRARPSRTSGADMAEKLDEDFLMALEHGNAARRRDGASALTGW